MSLTVLPVHTAPHEGQLPLGVVAVVVVPAGGGRGDLHPGQVVQRVVGVGGRRRRAGGAEHRRGDPDQAVQVVVDHVAAPFAPSRPSLMASTLPFSS